jgi:HAD superfamily hydrolase (TIGR01490 family)
MKAVVFDLDNTLVRGSCLFHFGREMVRRRRLAARHVLRYAMAEAAYVVRHQEPHGIAPAVAERALGLVAGMRQSELLDLADDFAATRLTQHLRVEVHLQLIDFTRAGYSTYLATASPQELATAIAANLGMTGAIGTIAETRDGRYTGGLAGPVAHGAAKAARVRALFEEHGIDAHSSWAFTDSVNDLPLLMLVGNPVAVYPDRDLAAIARVNGWRVLPAGESDEHQLARLGALYPFPF